jgi:hypothetical protein
MHTKFLQRFSIIESKLEQILATSLRKEREQDGRERRVGEIWAIIVTSIGCLFLFRVVGPGETSPVTWGFEKAKSKWLDKDPLSQVTTDQKVWFYNQ